MLKKIFNKTLVCALITCIIFPYFYINIIYAVPVDENGNPTNTETEQTPMQQADENINPNDDYTNTDDGNLSADVDDDTGLLLQILIEILMTVGDALISVLSSCMLGTTFEFVMVEWDELDTSNAIEANTTKTFTQEEIDKFKNNKGNVPELRYPVFKYTPEEIFKGEIDLFGIDFIGGNVVKNGVEEKNQSEGWNALRGTISSWYQTLRMIAIVLLLPILIYIGINIIISSNAGKKAEYKKSLVNWFIAVFLIFTMHYIMSFVISVIQNITTLIGKSIGNVRVVFGDKVFVTNFMGLARFQAQQNSLINKLGFLMIYICFIFFTVKFTFIYFKRMIIMKILTLISPLVAMMYPLDKLEGSKSKAFGLWLREYIYNGLLQIMHLLLYNLLIGSAVQLATENPVYTIVALFFLSEAEKLMKKLFGFGRARGGTVGGLAGTVGALALGSSVGNGIRDIIHSQKGINTNNFSDSKNESKNGSSKNSEYDEEYENEKFEKKYGQNDVGRDILDVDKNIYNIRNTLTNEDLQSDDENEKDENKKFENAFNFLKYNGFKGGKNGEASVMAKRKYKQMKALIKKSEDPFDKANMALQYNDEFSKYSSDQLFQKMKESIDKGDLEQAQKIYNALYRRLLENKFFNKHRGPEAFARRKYHNLSDEELKQRYEEAKSQNNQEDILECEAEMALRNKDYALYDTKLDEIEKYRLSHQNESNVHLNGTDSSGTNISGQSNNQQNVTDQEGEQNDSQNTLGTNVQPSERQPREHNSIIGEEKENRTNVGYNKEALGNKLDRMRRGTIGGLGAVASSVVRPLWDTDRNGKENLGRLGKKVAKGTLQTIFGVTTVAVQAGLSASDGKYTAKELGASLAGGVALGGKLYNKGEKAVKDMVRDTRYGRKETRKVQIAKDWSERDDIKNTYDNYYGSKSNEMLRRARDRFARQGITDVEDQKRMFRYSNYLRRQKGNFSEEEADKQAVEVFKFKRKMDNTYGIPEGKDARKQFIDEMVSQKRSSKSANEIRIYYSKMLENASDFEKVEDYEEYDFLN